MWQAATGWDRLRQAARGSRARSFYQTSCDGSSSLPCDRILPETRKTNKINQTGVLHFGLTNQSEFNDAWFMYVSMSMYRYVYACVSVSVYIYTHVYEYENEHVYVYVYILYIYIYVRECVCICTCTCMCMCLCMYDYACLYVCMCVRPHVGTCTLLYTCYHYIFIHLFHFVSFRFISFHIIHSFSPLWIYYHTHIYIYT